jgi:flavin-dependent dehydrogenase
MPSHDADAIVVGAGPAGSSCAIRLALTGWRVILIEQSRYPRQKVCGECLGIATLQLLDELGLGEPLADLAGPEIRYVGWMTDIQTAIAEMPAGRSGSHRYGRALGRDTLDILLLERAKRLGVAVIQPARVRSISGIPGDFACEYERRSDESGAGSGERTALVSAAVVIDAHGSWERGPARLHAERLDDRGRTSRPSDLLAFKASFQNASLPPGFLPLLALPGGYGGMVVADRGRTTVACCLRRDALRGCRQSACGDGAGAAVEAYLKDSCQGVAVMLDGARREEAWRSVGPLRLGFSAAAADGMLRVGNAAVEAHPLIGEGICMALQSAALLAGLLQPKPANIDGAFIRDCQERYARACRRAFARRLYWAQCYAHVAMRRSVATPLAALMQTWPHTLTVAARLAGKARSSLGTSAVRRSHEYA